MSKQRGRAYRRTETRRICSKRNHIFHLLHRYDWASGVSPEVIGRWSDPPPHKFAKHSNGCRCAKRRHGKPRVGLGICEIELRDWIYRWRRMTKEIDLAIQQGADPYGDYVATLEREHEHYHR
jgi:hypothetical protein